MVKARDGDLESAVNHGLRALEGWPQFAAVSADVSRDLTRVLNERYSGETQTQDYLDQLTSLADAG